MEKGFLCIFTIDRIDELRRFLVSFQKHNNLPISILLAKDKHDAHRIKTLCGFYTPFDNTIMMDIDIMIKGNLSEMFEAAKRGMIGIVREKNIKVLNSGVIVFEKEMMKKVCSEWNMDYEKRIRRGNIGIYGTLDQDLLNKILIKFAVIELDSKFNHILKDYSPEEELEIYNKVKVFHFLHHVGIDRNKYKSYSEFMRL